MHNSLRLRQRKLAYVTNPGPADELALGIEAVQIGGTCRWMGVVFQPTREPGPLHRLRRAAAIAHDRVCAAVALRLPPAADHHGRGLQAVWSPASSRPSSCSPPSGPPVALALLWVATGKRESLLVAPWRGENRSMGRAHPAVTHARAACYQRPSSEPQPRFGVLFPIWWPSGNSTAAATVAWRSTPTGRTFTVGHALSTEGCRQDRRSSPGTRPQPSGLPPAAGLPPARAANHAAAFMTMMMLGFALNGPVRLAALDRPICFYNGGGGASTACRCVRACGAPGRVDPGARSTISRSIARARLRSTSGRHSGSRSRSRRPFAGLKTPTFRNGAR